MTTVPPCTNTSVAPVVCSIAARPDLQSVVEAVDAESYRPFMRHADLSACWEAVYRHCPTWQLVLLDERSGEHLAHGNAVPFAWSGTSADLPRTAMEMVDRALDGRRRNVPPAAVGALQAVVNPEKRGRGLSAQMLSAMADHAARHGSPHLLAPVRPTQKERRPHESLERYVRRIRSDGLPSDPWQRVHHRLGAASIGVAPIWLTVTGTVSDWAGWTDMDFPTTGAYVVPGALAPVAIDRERDHGRYVEPHLWMHYRLSPAAHAAPDPTFDATA